MNQRLSNLLNSPLKTPVLVGVGSAGIGFLLGMWYERHLINKQVTKAEFKAEVLQIEKEIQDIPPKTVVSEAHPSFRQVEHIEDEEEEDEGRVISVYDPTTGITTYPEQDGTKHNIFASDDEWDYDEELKHRKPNEAYVIHKDEFFSNEMDFSQSTLTYYAGDEILVDEDDAPIYNHESFTGPLLFGHGSGGDPNVVYIRNEKRKSEFEILKEEALYSVEVLGLDIEDNDRVKDIKHSAVRKFRQE